MTRRRLMRLVGIGAAGALFVAWIAGLVVYPQRNPPERHTQPILGPAGEAVLRRACFDCHSNETRYPWFTRLPVASLIVGHDVAEGRRELNFSTWDRTAAGRRAEALRHVLKEVNKGEMPPRIYLPLHPEAAIGASDRALLQDEIARAAGAGEHGGGHEPRAGEESDDHDD